MAEKKMHPVLKVVVLIGAIGVTGTVGYYSYQAFKKWKDNKNAGATDPLITDAGIDSTIFGTSYGNTPKTCKHCTKEATFPLMKGSQGRQVAAVQFAYNSKFPNKTKLTVDGDWGNNSEKAFKALMGTSSSANGWSNFDFQTALDWVSVPMLGLPTTQTQTGASAGGAGSSLTKQGIKIDKTKYDKYFKGFENY